MKNCPYNNSCIRLRCDRSCKTYTEFEHWANRCGLTVKSPIFCAEQSKIEIASEILKKAQNDALPNSNYLHLGVYSGSDFQVIGDLITYLAIVKYCSGAGLYNGVYRLNFSQYLEETKNSWDRSYDTSFLDDIKIWLRTCRCLIIFNLSLIRFGDFESQTLLSIFQQRYDQNKSTIVVLEGGRLCLPGKLDSIFYQKLKNEMTLRGVRL